MGQRKHVARVFSNKFAPPYASDDIATVLKILHDSGESVENIREVHTHDPIGAILIDI